MPFNPQVVIDFETRSELNITKTSNHVYATHPSTEVMCLAYKINGKETQLWLPDDHLMPESLEGIINNGCEIWGHNVAFERAIWNAIMVPVFDWCKVSFNQWCCSAAQAAALSLPRSLDKVAKVLKLTEQKDASGHKVMMRLSKPRKPSKYDKSKWDETPEKLQKLYRYCKQDVETEYALTEKLPKLIPSEQKLWLLDQKINERGVYCDRETINTILDIIDSMYENACMELAEITGGGITTPNQRDRIKDFISFVGGLDMDSLNKEDVIAALETDLPPPARRVLEIRQLLGKASLAKYKAFIQRMSADDRVRNTLIYCGADRTGRWAGSGLQVHNIARGMFSGEDEINFCIDKIQTKCLDILTMIYDTITDVISWLGRSMIMAPAGKMLYCGDYSSIENRVLFWLARETKALKALKAVDADPKNNPDLYRITAGTIYNKQPLQVTNDERFIGKQANLGLGYGMGATKFKSNCEDKAAAMGMYLDLPPEFYKRVTKTWRSTYSNVKKFWNDIEWAVINAILDGKTSVVNKYIQIQMKKGLLLIQLPSGRCLVYHQPKLSEEMTSWGEMKYKISYMGNHSTSKKWVKIYSWGGKFVENIVQAVSRDLLAHAMTTIDEAGYFITMHVHDEIVCEESELPFNKFLELMQSKPVWALDCPIKVEGWKGKRYRK
ncbi:MAG: DNA polymerase [Candidatus Thorarchaeota archaeon]